MASLYLQSISKSFGDTQVLSDIELAIDDKEFVVFVGPSGCGKSTLLRIIAGLEIASAGSVVIDGNDVSKLHPVERGISMVFQSYALYPHLTVYENIAFPLRVQKLSNKEIESKVKQAAEVLQLTTRLQHKPGQLSGGQRQRVAIGRSIVRNPKIFLFDEPLSNLDAALRGDMRVELAQLHKDLAATMVYVTHDQIEAMTMADRIAVLNNGQVEQFGTPMELYHHPASKFVAGFIGQPNMNFIPASVVGVASNLLSVSLAGNVQLSLPVNCETLAVGDAIELGIRPEDIILNPPSDGFELNVSFVERLGGASITYGTVADNVRFCGAFDGNAAIQAGSTTLVGADVKDFHVFDEQGRALRRMLAPELAVIV